MNAKQRRALLIGIVGFIAIGGFPPWKDTSPPPAGTPLPFAPISMPPVVDGHSIEIDVTRLAIMWILMVVVTAASIWLGKESEGSSKEAGGSPLSVEPINQLPARSSTPKSSGAQILDSITSEAKASGVKSASQSTALRLKFPDTKVGELLTEAEDDPEYWTLVCDAKGRLEVPPGKRFQLELAKDKEVSLDFLSSMGSKDARSAIVSLDLSESELDLESLSYLKYLPSLEELDLSGTEIGDGELEEIAKLSQLKKLWLDDTNTSKAAAEKLSALSNLKKLSLSHLDGTEVEINSLKLRIPSCEVVVREGNK
ncbi:MAG: leucine-rich repeat domain-containing protein [Candidatus Obscuribacterales bacterium]|nr:leucine-rich repeat domain-containing protein [Candidatus Obscuribacterales bacterium]